MSTAWNPATKWIAMRATGIVRRIQAIRAERETRRDAPELMAAYAAFSQGSQSGAGRQPFKGWDLSRLLAAAKPRFVVELGSGTTSAVFASYALAHGARYLSYEHSEHWAEVTRKALESAGLTGDGVEIRFVPMRLDEDGRTSGFVEDLPPDADFLYVDGPPCPTRDGVKWANDDVTRLLATGARPRTIVVDGRVETVVRIRDDAAGAAYELHPSFVYALREGGLQDALAMREHSMLRLRAAS